jgi:hypothetical protein
MIPRGSVFENHLEIGIKKAGWCHSGVYEKEYLQADTKIKTTRSNEKSSLGTTGGS